MESRGRKKRDDVKTELPTKVPLPELMADSGDDYINLLKKRNMLEKPKQESEKPKKRSSPSKRKIVEA